MEEKSGSNGTIRISGRLWVLMVSSERQEPPRQEEAAPRLPLQCCFVGRGCLRPANALEDGHGTALRRPVLVKGFERLGQAHTLQAGLAYHRR